MHLPWLRVRGAPAGFDKQIRGFNGGGLTVKRAGDEK